MSRTVGQFYCRNPQDSEIVIQKILTKHGYERTEQNGDIFYQNGSSLFTPPKCIKYSFYDEFLTLEAWVVPFNMGSESDLKGILCSASKRQCQNVLKEIEQHLNLALVDNPNVSFIPQNEENHYVALGIGLALAIVSPLLGFVAALYFFIRGYEQSTKYAAIVLAVAAANWLLTFLFRVYGYI